jgi:glycogen(starch) synthase
MSNICIVTKTWRYSVPWIVQMLAQALMDGGTTVSLIAPLTEPVSREASSPKLTRVILHRERIDESSSWRRKSATVRRIFGCLIAVVRERSRTSTFLITIPDPLVFSLFMFAFLRLSGARTLFLVHDAVPHAWKFAPDWRWLERWAHALSYKLSSRLIVFTPILRDVLVAEFGIKSKKITIIPHGALQLQGVTEAPGNGRFLLFGTMRRNKSIAEVIKGIVLARQSDPGVSLVIAGEPHPSELAYWNECRKIIEADPNGFDVRQGFIADDDLPGLVATVDAFVMAYRNFDSQSGVGVVAALSNRPSLCTDVGGLKDLVAAGMSYEPILTPVTPTGVASAVRNFRRRPIDEWRAEARRAAEKVNRSMSWGSIALSYKKLI